MNALLDVKIYTAPLTRALKGFFLRRSVDVNPLPWFSRAGQEKIPSPFLQRSEEHVGV